MGRPIVWECDSCAKREETDGSYSPPDGWTHVSAHLSGSGRARSGDFDFCPDCARSVDTVSVGMTGTLLARPSSTKSKRSKADEGPSLLDDESPE